MIRISQLTRAYQYVIRDGAIYYLSEYEQSLLSVSYSPTTQWHLLPDNIKII
jgi:hypothetical protein